METYKEVGVGDTVVVPEAVVVAEGVPEAVVVAEGVPEAVVVAEGVPEAVVVAEGVPEAVVVAEVPTFCKAIIQHRKESGKRCENPPNENSLYCEKHIRNKEYDEGVEKGIKWCMYYFRGCNSHVSESESCCESCSIIFS